MRSIILFFFGLLISLRIIAQPETVTLISAHENTFYNYMIIPQYKQQLPSIIRLVLDPDAEAIRANPHPIGLWYDAVSGNWSIYNEDKADFPKGITFNNILKRYDNIRPESKNVYDFLQLQILPQQIVSGKVVIDNPRLNNNPNLQLSATHLYNLDGGKQGMYNPDYPVCTYDASLGKWILSNKRNTALLPGMVFNIATHSTAQVKMNIVPGIKNSAQVISKLEKIKFRVTINGFTCHSATADHLLEVDGKGDEIFFGGFSQIYNLIYSTKEGPAQKVWSVRYGDVNSEEGRMGLRIKAGSKPGNMGGIQTNDQFPAIEPWKRKAPSYTNTLPLLVSEGILTKGENAALVVPVIWEFDGTTEEEQALNNFASNFTQAVIYIGAGGVVMVAVGPIALPFVTVAAMSTGIQSNKPINGQPIENVPLFSSLDFKIPEFNVKVSKTLFGDAKDRPIGMTDAGPNYEFKPVGMMLNYETASAVSGTDFGFGRGIIPLHYKDAPAMGGDYTIYIQVETINENDDFENTNKVAAYSKTNNKAYRLQNVYSGASLSFGTNGQVFTSANSDRNIFYFEVADRFEDVYYIKSGNGLYISIPNTEESLNKNGAEVKIGTKPADNSGKWKVVSNSEGTYSIINMFTRKALIHDGQSGKVMVWENRANPEQRWIITN